MRYQNLRCACRTQKLQASSLLLSSSDNGGQNRMMWSSLMRCCSHALPTLCLRLMQHCLRSMCDSPCFLTCACCHKVYSLDAFAQQLGVWKTSALNICPHFLFCSQNLAAVMQIDTPTDMPARDRFARYQGLKSWRSSPWDPREGLPKEYANTFAFENFKRAHKR